MAGKLEALAKKHGIEYFLFNFTDLRGVQRSKLVPASAAPGMEKAGAGFYAMQRMVSHLVFGFGPHPTHARPSARSSAPTVGPAGR